MGRSIRGVYARITRATRSHYRHVLRALDVELKAIGERWAGMT